MCGRETVVSLFILLIHYINIRIEGVREGVRMNKNSVYITCGISMIAIGLLCMVLIVEHIKVSSVADRRELEEYMLEQNKKEIREIERTIAMRTIKEGEYIHGIYKGVSIEQCNGDKKAYEFTNTNGEALTACTIVLEEHYVKGSIYNINVDDIIKHEGW